MLGRARADLLAADLLAKGSSPLRRAALLHAQEAIAKSLMLVVGPERGDPSGDHDIAALIRRIEQGGGAVPAGLAGAAVQAPLGDLFADGAAHAV